MVSANVTTRALGADFDAPIDDRWFDDYVTGAVYEYGWMSVDADEIVDFGRRFDPQRMHTDPAWAQAGPYGGLIASGWQSAGVLMRLLADHYLSSVATLASPGVDELRWSAPLRPDVPVRLRTTIAETRPSRSKPDRGLVHTVLELLTADDACPISMRSVNLVLRRPS